MTLVDKEGDNNAGEDYLPPLKRLQTCSSQSQYEWSLSEDMLSYILKQFHSFETRSTPTTFSKNTPPFRGGPPASSYGKGGRGRATQAFFARTMPQTQRQYGMSKKYTFPQHSTTSGSGCRQVKSTSFAQKPFASQSETSSTGRKTKILFRKLKKINSRFEYFVHCAGFQNSFLPNPISVWPSQISKGEPRGKVTNKFTNKGNVQERCNSAGDIKTWRISEQFVLRKQEEWRSSTCNKSQISKQHHTIPAF